MTSRMFHGIPRENRGVGLQRRGANVAPAAVATLQLDGVVAEAGVEVAEVARGGGVIAEFEDAPLAAHGGLDLRRVIGRAEEEVLGLGDERAVGFGSLEGGLPVGVGHERLPGGFARLAAGVGEQEEDAGVLLVLERDPVPDAGDAVLVEEAQGVVAEALVEIVQLAGRGVVDAQFVASRVGGVGRGRGGARQGKERRDGGNDGEPGGEGTSGQDRDHGHGRRGGMPQ